MQVVDGITDREIEELEKLLQEQKIDFLKEGLTKFHEKTSPNYKFLHDSITSQKWGFDKNGKPELISGYAGCALEGSSRSTKTWGGVDIIIWLCLYVESNCTINIYRETYNEFKTTLYDDFKRRLDDFGLPNKFHNAEEVKSFRIGKNKINFLGDGKHGGGCDYAFFNEIMHISNQVFDQVEMRCRKFWWADYNPSFTDHWFFEKVLQRPDVGWLRTTFLDNHYISPSEKNKILSYEPWLPGSYEVTESGVFYNNQEITDKNQPPPHPTNVKNGTADEFMWKVYGLGLRGAMKGVVFPSVVWIDEFPNLDHTYANDFGFTADPNALVKYAEDEKNIYAELLCYDSVETPDDLDILFTQLGVEKHKPIICDSSDKYTGENKGTIEMVKGLKDLKWKASKVSKKKSVMYWILSMKKKRIHIVRNNLWKHAKKEQENYKFKEVAGIMINQPIDAYNHFWDATRYGHMSHNNPRKKAFGSQKRNR